MSTNQYGNFSKSCDATYEITSLNMQTSWEYIYQNRDVLLRVDQFGPVNAQVHPPKDIMLFKREHDDKFSKWLTWITCEGVNCDGPFTNFFRPEVNGKPGMQPQDFKITFAPHQAVYTGTIDGLRITTTFFIPREGTEILMTLKIDNLTERTLSPKVTPVLVPYVNPAQLAPWDKAEWYLKTALWKDKEAVFCTKLMNASGIKENRRTALLWTTQDSLATAEISLEKFCGSGDINRPETIFENGLRMNAQSAPEYGVYDNDNQIYGYPPVHAAQYSFSLKSGESKTIKQVLFVPPAGIDGSDVPLEQAQSPLYLFDAEKLQTEYAKQQEFFKKLFSVRSFTSGDSMLDKYINTWLPLQMYWVASLDRGWPTGMRGTRDCANDFMGMLPFDANWAKEILLLVMECQRSDGWFPRQISTSGREGVHDLRNFVDGGAFVLEFLNEYLCVSGDFKVLDKKLPWLDNQQENSVWEHACRAVDYYTDQENIGEHGLCKIRAGDWLDAVNRAGLKGRGESVMVTGQLVMDIGFMCDIADASGKNAPVEKWRSMQQKFKDAIIAHAYNKGGFFSSVFTDKGEWVFSNKDPDGQSRPYVSANAYAVLCGAADKEKQKTVFEALKTLKDETGYRLFYPPIGEKPIECVGRSGSGDGPIGLFENATPYNHGSHGFLGRSLAEVGNAEELLDVMYCMLPFSMEKHPTSQALSPPYAVVNCWQKLPLFYNRGGMPFLTGTIAMALRMAYNWMAGIRHGLNELLLAPCVSDKLGIVKVKLTARGKEITVIINPNWKKLLHNGKTVEETKTNELTQKQFFRISYNKLKDGDVIEFT